GGGLKRKGVELDGLIPAQRRDPRRKRKHPQFAHGRPPMNTRTWCLSRSCIRNNPSLPLRLARCSAASSTAKTARRIARSARSIGFRIFGMAGLTSVDRPLVAAATPQDLFDRARHLLDSANVANRREVRPR